LACEPEKKGGHLYRPTLLKGKIHGRLYDYQISGAVTLILKLFGKVDIPRVLEKQKIDATDPRAVKALAASEKLRALKLNGALLADETGFAKTKQALLVKKELKKELKNNA
jgi:hypothetical protein